MRTQSLIEAVQARRDWTLKRAAWAYGCAKKGSVEEALLLEVLLASLRRVEVPT